MNDVLPYIAIIFSGVTLAIMVGEKLFGGGASLAAQFHKMDMEKTAQITALRVDLNNKIDEYESVATVGFDAIKANIHEMQLALLKFRADTSENLHLYIRKDEHNAAMNDIKNAMQNGFRRVDDRLGEIQDLVMYANPDLHNKAGTRGR